MASHLAAVIARWLVRAAVPRLGVSFSAIWVMTACNRSPANDHRPAPNSSSSATPSSSVPGAVASLSSDAGPIDSADAATTESAADGCPSDMLLVEGNFCPEALQLCARHHPEYMANSSVSERCLAFHAPSRCLSKSRRSLRLCIDRYEWPNQKGKIPLVLVTWAEAKQKCESAGKRLCDEEEWLFACEGEQMLPHVYGYERDPEKCQIDRPYRKRERPLKRYEPCMRDPECKREFDKLDQRVPSGSFEGCVSPFGAFDMNGGVNEWVNVPGKQYPHRSGLKGGWWGPVRCRCRPTVLFHKEDDWGYEAGFRCCKDAIKR